MNKMKLEMPVKINGVIITERIISELGTLQNTGRIINDNPEVDNSGIKQYNEDIDFITRKIIATVTFGTDDEIKTNLHELLTRLHYLHNCISSFAAPQSA